MGAILSAIRNFLFSLRSLATLIAEANAEFSKAEQRVSEPRLPQPSTTKSFWQQHPPFPELVNIKSETLPSSADIVIIGSGIAGASVAHTILNECHATGDTKRVVLLEARELCSGATGRNGGHIKVEAYHLYGQYKARFGAANAKKLCEFQLMHLPTLLEISRVEGLDDAEAREVETVDVFTDLGVWEKAQGMVHELRKEMPTLAGGISIHTAAEAQERFGVAEHCVGAITYKAGAMWPYRFVTCLYKKLLKKFEKAFTIETGTVVEQIKASDDLSYPAYLLQTSRGQIAADVVIHATDAFAANVIPGLKGKLFPIRGHMSAQRPGTSFPDLDGKRSWSFVHKNLFDYVTQRPGKKDADAQGLGAEIMMGGGLVQSPAQGVDEVGIWNDYETSFPIASYLSGILSVAFSPKTWGNDQETRVKALWTGCMGFTADVLPLVGRLEPSLTNRKQRIGAVSGEYIVAGFGGDGMIFAWLSGVALGLMILERDRIVSDGADGRPSGQVQDWFPDQLRCSQARVDKSSLAELATLL